MKNIIKHIVRFVIFVLAQALVFSQLNLGYGIHPMICSLYILLLPFDTRPIMLILIGFALGLSVDFFMNTFGLHASAAVLIAFLRPYIYTRFAPRDGYDSSKEPTAKQIGYRWFIQVALITIIIHHFWFFLLEYFKWGAWKEILINTLLSSIITLLIFILIQIIFFNKHKTI